MKTEADRKILIIDDVAPEANAMLQALYSRDPQSVTAHLERVKKVGPEKFMSSYYVGYGHKSIGDCGTTTLYIEQVSLLAAKAIQDWPLYNGQEASTRYLDMSGQAVLNPAGSKEGESILRRWMSLYETTLAHLVPYLLQLYPTPSDTDDRLHLKAIQAKAFDIARGLLPAGITTLLAWHTNLRQAHDHLKRMRHHPLDEVRVIAHEIIEKLQATYPNSFGHKQYATEEAYLQTLQPFTYASPDLSSKFEARSFLRSSELSRFSDILRSRPAKAELPHELRAAGDLEFQFLLDFGSFRDLQRHRSVVIPMPLLTTRYGFEEWYLEQLPPNLRPNVETEIQGLLLEVDKLPLNDETKQYYLPLGLRVGITMTAALPAAVYLCELRSGQTVHPTLRHVSQQIGRFIESELPDCAIHCDYSPDAFSTKRGTQDIVKREAA